MFEDIEYEVGGRTFTGVLAAPTSGTRTNAAVLVLHGGSGPGDHERERVERLAALGYAALAPDLFGETFPDRARGMAVIGELVAQPERLRARARAAWHALVTRAGVDPARTGVVGHCFGGLAALELARSGVALGAAVSVHGGLTTRQPAQPGLVRARVLALTGADDPFCPRDHRTAFEDEMTSAGADWQHHIYAGARHGFSVPGIDPARNPGCAYHELADQRSWRAMLGLFGEVFA